MAEPLALNTEEHLGRKAFVLFALERMRVPLGTLVIALALSIVADGTASITLADIVHDLYFISFLLFILMLGWVWLEYNNYSFMFEEFDLVMHSGVLNKKQTVIPYRQIQSIDVVRNVSHQMLGLSKVVILTAGHEEADEKGLVEVRLDPVDKERGDSIRELLERKVGVEVVKSEKQADAEADTILS